MGDDDQLDLYLRRGLESGLTRTQMAERYTSGLLRRLGKGDEGDRGGDEDTRQIAAQLLKNNLHDIDASLCASLGIRRCVRAQVTQPIVIGL